MLTFRIWNVKMECKNGKAKLWHEILKNNSYDENVGIKRG